MTRRERPTIADIAAALNLSAATVSRALRASPEISENTRGSVRRVAREMGYVPNAAARNLARQASRTLGLIVPDVTDPVHGQIVAGFGRAADQLGYTVMVLDGAREPARLQRSLRILIEHQAQGVALCGAPVSAERMAAEIRPAHAVFIFPEGDASTASPVEPLGLIRADDERGMGLLVRHLLDSGMTRLSYVNGPDISSNRVRRRAVLRTLEALGIEPRIREYHAGDAMEDLPDVARAVARERPDALICYDDKMALHLMDALRHEGLRVPEDIAVTGFDGIPFAAISNPRLTTVEQPAETLGEIATRSLVEAIENGTPPPDIVLPVTLAVRGSTRRANVGHQAARAEPESVK
jgi:LacI family transcriptional regulator